MPEKTLAAYYQHDVRPPDETADGVAYWYAAATNFTVETARVPAGARLRLTGHPGEHLIILSAGSAALTVSTSDTKVTADEPGVVIVPPGDSAVEALRDGYVYRVFTCFSPVHARARAYGDGDRSGGVAPLTAAAPPAGGYALRYHRVSDFPGDSNKRVFRGAEIMVSMLFPSDTPRDPARLSPHCHDDFEQGCLVAQGRYVHHLRRTWGADSTRWRDDEHQTVGAPSVTVISPPDVHTSQTVGTGPFRHVDIFCPPRADFLATVLNAEDYPS